MNYVTQHMVVPVSYVSMFLELKSVEYLCNVVNLEGVNVVETGTTDYIFTVNRGTGIKL